MIIFKHRRVVDRIVCDGVKYFRTLMEFILFVFIEFEKLTRTGKLVAVQVALNHPTKKIA